MAFDLQAVGQNAAGSIQRMSGPQRVTLGLAFVATALSVFLVARTAGQTQMRVLYPNLEPSTAGDIVTELDAQGIPYELTNGGRTIQVPADRVDSIRLDMTARKIVQSDVGWSIMDDQSLTSTTFQQQIAYQRAMEAELAGTIASIDGVRSANVHLAIPEHDLFVDDANQASAAVMVDTGGTSLAPTQVDAIVNVVAFSIEGLTKDQVSVSDESGRVLAAPDGGSGVVGLEGDLQLRSKHLFESALENDIEDLLEMVVGPGLAMVTVSAELDFDAQRTESETLEPILNEDGTQAKNSATTRDEIYIGEGAAADDGQLEVELPEDEAADGDADAAATGDGLSYTLNEEDVSYAINRVITTAEDSVGDVTSLSIAVLIDEASVDANRAADIQTMIEAAAGLDADRGDTLAVTLLPMDEDVKAAIEASSAAEAALPAGGGLDLVSLLRTVGTIIVALVVIVLGLRYLSKGPQRRVVESVDVEEIEANAAAKAVQELEAGLAELEAEAQAAAEAAAAEAEAALPAEERLQSLIANQTDDVAGVLRTWLNEAEEVPV